MVQNQGFRARGEEAVYSRADVQGHEYGCGVQEVGQEAEIKRVGVRGGVQENGADTQESDASFP